MTSFISFQYVVWPLLDVPTALGHLIFVCRAAHEKKKLLNAGGLRKSAFHHKEKSYYSKKSILHITMLFCGKYPRYPFATYYFIILQPLATSFVPPCSGLCNDPKPLILHETRDKRDCSPKALSLHSFLSSPVFICAYWHAGSPTRTLGVVLKGVSVVGAFVCCNIVPSSRLNSKPVIQQLS